MQKRSLPLLNKQFFSLWVLFAVVDTLKSNTKLVFHNLLNTFCPFQHEMDVIVATTSSKINTTSLPPPKYCKWTYGTISTLAVQLCRRGDLLPLVLKFQKEKLRQRTAKHCTKQYLKMPDPCNEGNSL